jgi:adenylate cyclase class 2
MLEVEMKFPAPDPAGVLAKVLALGPQTQPARIEVDQYFNGPDRNFGQTDEALRIRRVNEKNVVTYKGPKLDAVTKTRREVELPLHEGSLAASIAASFLIGLGYRPTAQVRKLRQPYDLQVDGFAAEICFDQVDEVGHFVEVEIIAPPEQLDAARQAVQALAQRLGLEPSERRSYLQMLLERRSQS